MPSLLNDYIKIRKRTCGITEPLAIEDYCIQPLSEISPPKWHLAHTTWFFEALVLNRFMQSYQPFDTSYNLLFNSYYNSLGPHKRQSERHLYSRPTVTEIFNFRNYVDKSIQELLDQSILPEVENLINLGLNHEQQHQELLYMDIKGIYFQQTPRPAFTATENTLKLNPVTEIKYPAFSGGLVSIGCDSKEFCYDNELPVHKYYLHPFRIRSTLVSNAEYLEFMQAGGYRDPELWYSDGWDWLQTQTRKHPLYWVQNENEWFEFDLDGLSPLQPQQPVKHINFYEASAYARFHKKRLPTEFEWEYAAASKEIHDCTKTLWQWTNSAYAPYPGHQWNRGPLGEYNSKFMVNQMVLRGGSAWTPENHTRLTYRNYFQPDKKWPFTGIRLAEDI